MESTSVYSIAELWELCKQGQVLWVSDESGDSLLALFTEPNGTQWWGNHPEQGIIDVEHARTLPGWGLMLPDDVLRLCADLTFELKQQFTGLSDAIDAIRYDPVLRQKWWQE